MSRIAGLRPANVARELQRRLESRPSWCLGAAVALVVGELVVRPRLGVTFAVGYGAVAVLLGFGAVINFLLAAAAIMLVGIGGLFGWRSVSVDAGIAAVGLAAAGIALACVALWREGPPPVVESASRTARASADPAETERA